jgi:hypothetical protein
MSNDTIRVHFPAAVRARVLEQHGVLRELLQRALATTTRAFEPEGTSPGELGRLVWELRTRFFAHLAFEERALVPVLAHVDLWGPERVRELLAEHARQRAEVETLIAVLDEDAGAERVAVALRSLATDLLLDMEEEERGCVSAALLGDEMMVVGTSARE